MHDIAALSIDLDDTLWPVWPAIALAERRLYEFLQRHCPRVTAAHTPGCLERLRVAIAERHPQRAHDYAFLRRSVIAEVVTGADYAPEFAERGYEVFVSARNEVEPFDDVVPTLEKLQSQFRLIALTNGNADLARIGLGRYFDAAIRAADVGVPKPDARMFDAAVAAAGVPPARILHIGDAPREDVAGAHRAGMQTAWIDRDQREWPSEYPAPHLRLRSFGEVLDALDA